MPPSLFWSNSLFHKNSSPFLIISLNEFQFQFSSEDVPKLKLWSPYISNITKVYYFKFSSLCENLGILHILQLLSKLKLIINLFEICLCINSNYCFALIQIYHSANITLKALAYLVRQFLSDVQHLARLSVVQVSKVLLSDQFQN